MSNYVAEANSAKKKENYYENKGLPVSVALTALCGRTAIPNLNPSKVRGNWRVKFC
jgi:hypothetical protein